MKPRVVNFVKSRDNATDQGELYAEANDGKSTEKSRPWTEAIKVREKSVKSPLLYDTLMVGRGNRK